jgi:hypothetical protein
MPWMLRPNAVCWPAMSWSWVSSQSLLPIAGEAALAYGFGACAHAGACGYDGAVYRDLGLEVDAAGQAPGQLAGV